MEDSKFALPVAEDDLECFLLFDEGLLGVALFAPGLAAPRGAGRDAELERLERLELVSLEASCWSQVTPCDTELADGVIDEELVMMQLKMLTPPANELG